MASTTKIYLAATLAANAAGSMFLPRNGSKQMVSGTAYSKDRKRSKNARKSRKANR